VLWGCYKILKRYLHEARSQKHGRRLERLLRLSYTLKENSPVHIGLKKLGITPVNQISYGDDYNTYYINLENHCGTHVDAPAHFLEGGRKIYEYQPDELRFRNPLIFDCFKNPGEIINDNDVSKIELKHYDSIFIRTGFDNTEVVI
jgi:arylformamidase